MHRRSRKPISIKKHGNAEPVAERENGPSANENGERERPLPRWFWLADPLRPSRALLYISGALFCAWIAFLLVLAWLA